MNALELRAAFAAGERSPVEAVSEALERIERVNPRLNAFVTAHPGAGAGGRPGRRAGIPRRDGRAAGRDPDHDQGSRPAGRRPLHDGFAGARAPHLAAGRPPGRPHPRRRGGHPGQDDHPRVRLEGRDHQPRLRLDPQPLAPRADAGRLQRRRLGSGGRRDGPAAPGRRRRRLDPHPRGAERGVRDQADDGHGAAADQQRPLLPGADRARRGRRGAAAGGDGPGLPAGDAGGRGGGPPRCLVGRSGRRRRRAGGARAGGGGGAALHRARLRGGGRRPRAARSVARGRGDLVVEPVARARTSGRSPWPTPGGCR